MNKVEIKTSGRLYRVLFIIEHGSNIPGSTNELVLTKTYSVIMPVNMFYDIFEWLDRGVTPQP